MPRRTSSDSEAAPLLFEAALAQGRCFTLDSEGEARLTLAVPEQFARILSDNIHRLRERSFVVQITGLARSNSDRNRDERE